MYGIIWRTRSTVLTAKFILLNDELIRAVPFHLTQSWVRQRPDLFESYVGFITGDVMMSIYNVVVMNEGWDG